MRERERWASLVSGGGTTMREMIREYQSGRLPIEIACIISSNPTAGAIEKALTLGIPEYDIVVVDPNNFRGDNGKIDQDEFGYRIVQVLREHDATVVTQNGWLPKTPRVVINAFSGNIFNQHPGPVPEFGGKGMYGRRVHAAVLLFNKMIGKSPWSEVIAQRVAPRFDQGHVVGSERVSIADIPLDYSKTGLMNATSRLQERALPIEHGVQIGLLHDIANKTVTERVAQPRPLSPQEEAVLDFAKRMARLLYPQG